jgi:hypothetical protein
MKLVDFIRSLIAVILNMFITLYLAAAVLGVAAILMSLRKPETVGTAIARVLLMLLATILINFLMASEFLRHIEHGRYLLAFVAVLLPAGLNYFAFVHVRVVIRVVRRTLRSGGI